MGWLGLRVAVVEKLRRPVAPHLSGRELAAQALTLEHSKVPIWANQKIIELWARCLHFALTHWALWAVKLD